MILAHCCKILYNASFLFSTIFKMLTCACHICSLSHCSQWISKNYLEWFFGGGGQESHRYGDITHLELNEDHTFSNFLCQVISHIIYLSMCFLIYNKKKYHCKKLQVAYTHVPTVARFLLSQIHLYFILNGTGFFENLILFLSGLKRTFIELCIFILHLCLTYFF